MITSPTDPRDDRFLLFLREAQDLRLELPSIPEGIDNLSEALRTLSEAVETHAGVDSVAQASIELAAWALSPDPVSLLPCALEGLRHLRKDPVRARNVAGGTVDWVLGQVRHRVSGLQKSWQTVHDVRSGYPLDSDLQFVLPAEASADVAVWSYALLRAAVSQQARGLKAGPTTLADAARRGAAAERTGGANAKTISQRGDIDGAEGVHVRPTIDPTDRTGLFRGLRKP